MGPFTSMSPADWKSDLPALCAAYEPSQVAHVAYCTPLGANSSDLASPAQDAKSTMRLQLPLAQEGDVCPGSMPGKSLQLLFSPEIHSPFSSLMDRRTSRLIYHIIEHS